jgi:predicted PurR-regulated permease PerM
MDSSFEIPFYAQAALIFISGFALIFTMHIGQQIIVPILYATILAILLNPLVNYLIKKRINKIVAITFAVTVAIVVIAILLYIITSRLALFSESYPHLKEKFNDTTTDLVRWWSQTFNVRQWKINIWLKESQTEAIDDIAIGESLSEVGRVLVMAMLLPVYVFMILYYKPLLLEFIRKLFRSEHHLVVVEVLTNSKQIIQTYLVGLSFELIIMAILHSVGLLLLGIDYAIILNYRSASQYYSIHRRHCGNGAGYGYCFCYERFINLSHSGVGIVHLHSVY